LISVEQALDKVLENITVLGAAEAPILDCLGQALAEDVYAEINIPPQDNSAMDGFAVRAADTRGASPKSPRILCVIDTVIAGAVSRAVVETGTTVRIMTGAPIPKGADAVVRFEDSDHSERDEDSAEAGILAEVTPGTEIRRVGEDIAKGSLVLKKGTMVRPAEVGVLASLGRAKIKVIRRPVVAVLATGDELVDVAQPLAVGKIYNSNSYSLAALVRRYGGIAKMLGIAADIEGSILQGLRASLAADMLVTSGGVSMGDYDIVRDVLAKEGELIFWGVRQRPGKPLAFGLIKARAEGGGVKKIPFFGLAGNPVSAMLNFELFVRPAMLKMMGQQNLAKPVIEATIEEPIINSDGRRIFARAVVRKRDGNYFARLTGNQSSGVLTSMAIANGLVIVPEDKSGVKKGDSVQVIMLDWGEELA
jgi:molybdopterin molybdotransferase